MTQSIPAPTLTPGTQASGSSPGEFGMALCCWFWYWGVYKCRRPPGPSSSQKFPISFWEADGIIIFWLLVNIVEQDSFKHFQKDGLHICCKSGEKRTTTNSQRIHLLYILICTFQYIVVEKTITFLPKMDGRKVVLDILRSSVEGDKSGHIQPHLCLVAPTGLGDSWRQNPA